MNQLQIFNFEENDVRTLTINNEPFFVGRDVAEILGYSNSRDALSKHVDVEDKLKSPIATLGQNRRMTVINESGLYALIFGSKLKSAKAFKRWVTSEVLPSIRKTGTYMTDKIAQEITNNPEIITYLAEQVAKINTSNNQFYNQANQKLETIDKKIEGEYVTPQDLYAINYAIKVKSEKFVDDAGTQLTIDSVLAGDIYEQAQASKKAKEQRKYDIGKVKRQILVAVKKYLGMKGNAPNNHIKRKDVDAAVQFIKNVKQSELNAS